MDFVIRSCLNISIALFSLGAMAQATCDSALVAYYDFQGNCHDQSGNDFHGLAFGNAKVTDRLEIMDDAGAVFLPTHMLQSHQDFSISCRVKFNHFHVDGAAPINVIINGYSDNNAFVIGYRKLANIVHLTFNGIGTDLPLPFELLEGQWYCLVFVREGMFGSIYLDGLQAGSPVQIGPNPTSLDVLLLGQDQDCPAGCFASNQSLDGQLDNLRIYGRALSNDDATGLCATESDEVNICEGEAYQGFNETGEYISYLHPSNGGCEVMHLLQLTVFPVLDTSLAITLCPGESYNGIASPGLYPIRLQSENGCDSTVYLAVEVSNPPYFPSAFSPNGDGINDYFGALGQEGDFEVTSFLVFDRWGGLCHKAGRMKANELDNAWDGNVGKVQCPAGIYTWLAHLRLSCGQHQWWSGAVTLIR